MYLLDTVAVSEAVKRRRNAGYATWFAQQLPEIMFVSVISLAEIARGATLVRGRDPVKAQHLEGWLINMRAAFADRLLSVDDRIAITWGRLTATQPTPPHDDSMLNYVQHLTRGRLFDGADRAADAASAYRRALEAEPRSQLAAIGLAAALLRSARADEAVDAAARARTLGAEHTRHDQAFRQADLRFVRGWLSEIRRLRR